MAAVRFCSIKTFVALVAATTLIPASREAAAAAGAHRGDGSLTLVGSAASVGATEMVSVRYDGAQTLRRSLSPTVSATGRFVAFSSRARISNAPVDLTDLQVYVRDMDTGVSRLVSRARGGGGGNADSNWASISADGTRIVYNSAASNLVAGDTNGYPDVYMYDTQTKTTSLISHRPDGGAANFGSFIPYISADGTHVVYTSSASDLVGGSGARGEINVYLHDIAAGTTKLVSHGTGDALANDESIAESISADGNLVTFRSLAANLIPDDNNGRTEDVFLYNASTGQNQIISGTPGEPANAGSGSSAISGNGNYVAYSSAASNLVADDNNGRADVFLYDVEVNSTTLISRGRGGLAANGDSFYPTISRDGTRIAYLSWARNLVAEPDSIYTDIYVFDTTTESTRLITKAPNGSPADDRSDGVKISLDGRYIAYDSRASNLVPGDNDAAAPNPRDVFRYRLS